MTGGAGMQGSDDDIAAVLRAIRTFEWDEAKRRLNIERHQIDFADASAIFEGPILAQRSDRHNEVRYAVIGIVAGREVALTCTIRSGRCRVISVRKARTYERQAYRRKSDAGHPPWQD
jgi:uncharacterized DUF497 family protein